jgi:hypothetical protein
VFVGERGGLSKATVSYECVCLCDVLRCTLRFQKPSKRNTKRFHIAVGYACGLVNDKWYEIPVIY